MLGTDNDPGIMALALNDLFLEMERTYADMSYRVSMSYLEVKKTILLSLFKLCYFKPRETCNFSVETDFRRQNLTSIDFDIQRRSTH